MDKKVEEKLLKGFFAARSHKSIFSFQSLIQFTVERSKWTLGSGRLINGIPKRESAIQLTFDHAFSSLA